MSLKEYARNLTRHAEGLDREGVAAFLTASAVLAATGGTDAGQIGAEARAMVDEARPEERAALAAAFEEDEVGEKLKAEFKAPGLRLRGEEIDLEPEEARSRGERLREKLGKVEEMLDALLGGEEPDLRLAEHDDDEEIEINIDEDEDEDDELDASPVDMSADARDSITLAARVAALENRGRMKGVIARALRELQPYGLATDEVRRELRKAAKRAGVEGVRLFAEAAKKYATREPGDDPDGAAAGALTAERLSEDAQVFASLGHEPLEAALSAEREICELRSRGMRFKMSNAEYMRDQVRRAGHDVSGIRLNREGK